MKYVGIDASLTNTGVAIYDTDNCSYTVASFPSSAVGDGLSERCERHTAITNSVLSEVDWGDVALAAIEGPSLASKNGRIWERAGLWWGIVKKILDAGSPIIEIPPTSRAKYATGKGNAGKDEVLLAVSRTYLDADIKNNDEADAVVLCAMAARLDSNPVDGDLSKNKLSALDKIIKD